MNITDEQIEQIKNEAYLAMQKYLHGIRGATLTRMDSMDYWVMRATLRMMGGELVAAKTTLAKWIEWARMHGHLDHAGGIADDSRRIISSEIQ